MSLVSVLFACTNTPTSDTPTPDTPPVDEDEDDQSPTDVIKQLKYTDFVSVNGGTFVQKSHNNKSFSHTVSDFSIGKYEVTYELWSAVYTWALENGYTFGTNGYRKTIGTKKLTATLHRNVSYKQFRSTST